MKTLTADQVKALPTPFDPDPRYAEWKKAWAADDLTEAIRMGAGRPYGGNRAMAGIWRKGALAAIGGEPLDAVPNYDAARTHRGGITFGRAFEIAWCEGWHYGMYGDESKCKLRPNHTATTCSFSRQPAPHEMA